MAKTSVYNNLAIYLYQSSIEIGQGREKSMDTVLLTSIGLLFRNRMQNLIPAN